MGIHLDDGPLPYMDVTSMIDGEAAAESGRRQETPAATENAKGPSLENAMFRLRELVTAAYEALHKASRPCHVPEVKEEKEERRKQLGTHSTVVI